MSLAIVLGSGGHTGELIKILNNLPKRHQNLSQQVFCASDDTLSVSKYLKYTFSTRIHGVFITQSF